MEYCLNYGVIVPTWWTLGIVSPRCGDTGCCKCPVSEHENGRESSVPGDGTYECCCYFHCIPYLFCCCDNLITKLCSPRIRYYIEFNWYGYYNYCVCCDRVLFYESSDAY